MSCSLDKTKELALKKGVVNKFNKLAEDSGAGVTKFNQFVKELKDLAFNKYGEKANTLATPMRLEGRNVKYNISFFNAIDNINEGEELPSYKKPTSEETKVSRQVLETISSKLSDKLGIEYEIITPQRAEELTGGLSTDPFYHTDGKVYMVEGSFTLETPIHEFSHPFVRAIAKKNPKLFENIVGDVLSTPEGESLETLVKQLYSEKIDPLTNRLTPSGYEELVVRALTEVAKGNVNPKTGKPFLEAIKRLLLQFKQLFREVFGKTSKVADLNENTTLQELADMLTIGHAKIDLTSSKSRTYGSYQKFRNMPFHDTTIDRMASGDQSVTIRPKSHQSGIYILNGEEYHIENLGLKKAANFKDINALKDDFKGDTYEEGKFEHIDDFFRGIESMYVYQITKLNEAKKAENISFKRSLDLNEDIEPEAPNYSSEGLKTVINEIKNVLIKQKALFKKQSNSKKFVDDIDKILKTMDQEDNDLESVLEFIADSNKYINELFDRFNQLREQLDRDEILTPFERNNALNLIKKISELTSSYEVLEDLMDVFGTYESTPVGGEINMLQRTINRKNKLTKAYKELGKDLITDWLYNEAIYVNEKLQAEGKSKYILSRNKIKDELELASSDIGFFESILGSAISSKDPITALAAKAIKAQMLKANEDDLDTKEEVLEAYEKDGAPSIEQNRRFIHEIELPETITEEDGTTKIVYNKAKAIITKYRTDLFDKAKRDFFKSLGARPADPKEGKEYDKKKALWFKANQDIRSDADIIVDNKRKELSADEFNLWIKENTRVTDNIIYRDGTTLLQRIKADNPKAIFSSNNKQIYLYSGELTRPSDKYLNPEYNKVKDNQYYQTLLRVYNESNDRLPLHNRLRYGILPQIVKNNIETTLSETFSKENLKDAFNTQTYDTKYSLQTLSGETYHSIPIRHVIKIDEKLVSEDLLESVLKFSQMSNNYKYMSDIKANVDILMDIVRDRAVVETNSKGEQMMDKVTNALRKKSKSEAKKVNQRLQEFINMAFYGEEELKSSFNLLGKDISTNKVASKIQFLSSMSMMAGNITGGIANAIWGNYQTLAQSIGGKSYTKAEWLSAFAHYNANIPMYAGDIGKRIGKSKDNQLAEIFDAIQGDFKDQYGNNISGSTARRLMSTNTLFFNQSATEHQIQLTSMIAMLKHHKVKTTAGEEISLYDAFVLEGNRYRLRSDVNFSQKDKFAFMNNMHSINKRLHGVYNSFDKPELQRQWYGKMVLMFRKHIYKGMTQRYGKERRDEESGEIIEGYYRTYLSKLSADLKEFGIQGILNYKNYTPEQQVAFKKTMLDTTVLLSCFILGGLLGAGDDDTDEKTWAQNMAILQMRRLKGDINFYTPLGIVNGDLARILNKPTVIQNTIGSWVDLVEQLSTDPTGVYERKSGIHDKGDSKLKARFLKVVPVVRSITSLLTPEEQVKIFNKY